MEQKPLIVATILSLLLLVGFAILLCRAAATLSPPHPIRTDNPQLCAGLPLSLLAAVAWSTLVKRGDR